MAAVIRHVLRRPDIQRPGRRVVLLRVADGGGDTGAEAGAEGDEQRAVRQERGVAAGAREAAGEAPALQVKMSCFYVFKNFFFF